MHEGGKGYKWRLAVRLDNSFQFLLTRATDTEELVSRKRPLYFSWLAGLVDSDGNIHTSEGGGRGRVRVVVFNNNTLLLQKISTHSQLFGYHFDGPYLLQPRGTITPSGITYTKDMWSIQLQRTEEAQKLLLELPLRHEEKLERKTFALTIGAKSWSETGPKLLELKERIKTDVANFRLEALASYEQKLQRRSMIKDKDPKPL
jgi:hypothetical protein